jgi:hypothetical protein
VICVTPKRLYPREKAPFTHLNRRLVWHEGHSRGIREERKLFLLSAIESRFLSHPSYGGNLTCIEAGQACRKTLWHEEYSVVR